MDEDTPVRPEPPEEAEPKAEGAASPEAPASSQPASAGSSQPSPGAPAEPPSVQPPEPPAAADLPAGQSAIAGEGGGFLEGAPSAEISAQEPEAEPGSFPCPFDEAIEYEIVEPPEGEESDDGFASIPPGPTEEVNFEPPRVRGPRRHRERGRREPVRAGAPAPAGVPQTEMEPEPASEKRFPIWLAVAGAVLVVAIIAVVVLLILHGR